MGFSGTLYPKHGMMMYPDVQLEATTILSFKDRGNKKELLNNGFGAAAPKGKMHRVQPRWTDFSQHKFR